MIDKLSSILCRLFFSIALILLISAGWDKLIGLFGWKIAWNYNPGRILEFSAIMIIFVIGILLRQIRNELKNKHS